MNRVVLSIIIPCNNIAKYIGVCLDKLLLQKTNDVEIICVDDGSTDNTKDIIETYAGKIKLICTSHKGVSAARNIGATFAQGSWVWFIDGDDRVENGAIRCILDSVEKCVDIVMYGARIQEADLAYKGSRDRDIIVENAVVDHEPFSSWISKLAYPYVWNCVYNKLFLTKNNIQFCERLAIGEDMAFQMAAFYKAKAYKTVDSFIYVYNRTRSDSAMNIVSKKPTLIPYHICVLDEVLKITSDSNAKTKKQIYKWAYDYVVAECLDKYEYIGQLQPVWQKHKGYLPLGAKNRIKGHILRSKILCKLYAAYRKRSCKDVH